MYNPTHPTHLACCTCGYVRQHGQNGDHSCVSRLVEQRDILRSALETIAHLPDNRSDEACTIASRAIGQHDTQTNNTHDRRPIDELVAEYAAEGCDFTDRFWMHNVVARHVETMPDSLARCLLHVLRPPAEDPCFCCSDISLQIVSGGGSQEGYLGRITCLVDGKYVDYVRAEH